MKERNKWIKFDNKEIPCISKIDIKNNDIQNTIKCECVLLIYKYDAYIM
jgi:hypothetical protein